MARITHLRGNASSYLPKILMNKTTESVMSMHLSPCVKCWLWNRGSLLDTLVRASSIVVDDKLF